MIQYILRILSFLLFMVICACLTLKDFIFGDIKVAWRDLKDEIPGIKECFWLALHGESFL